MSKESNNQIQRIDQIRSQK